MVAHWFKLFLDKTWQLSITNTFLHTKTSYSSYLFARRGRQISVLKTCVKQTAFSTHARAHALSYLNKMSRCYCFFCTATVYFLNWFHFDFRNFCGFLNMQDFLLLDLTVSVHLPFLYPFNCSENPRQSNPGQAFCWPWPEQGPGDWLPRVHRSNCHGDLSMPRTLRPK